MRNDFSADRITPDSGMLLLAQVEKFSLSSHYFVSSYVSL